jgi:hypothetical protein
VSHLAGTPCTRFQTHLSLRCSYSGNCLLQFEALGMRTFSTVQATHLDLVALQNLEKKKEKKHKIHHLNKISIVSAVEIFTDN